MAYIPLFSVVLKINLKAVIYFFPRNFVNKQYLMPLEWLPGLLKCKLKFGFSLLLLEN
jgi:hypothetical protein